MQLAWKKYLSANVPRYTSYPSALGFSGEVGTDRYAQALRGIAQYEPISLYLHIPFCKQLCWYCGCNMKVENSHERISRYVEDLIAEIEVVGALLGGHGMVSQLHFGGGTPNTLRLNEVERLLSAVEVQFGLTDTTPIAMEIDPRLCSRFQAMQLVRAGVSRFSIGVQDFDPDVQKAINRIQSYELVQRCMADLREAGVEDISLDVLYGLPHQQEGNFARTIEQVISLRPDRISLFGYAHMPSRFRHQKLIDEKALPSRDLRITLAEDAAEQLMAEGYERIGFDHFALPSTPIAQATREHRLNRNFQGFTEDSAQNVIGLGVSAISTVHGVIAQNAKFLPTYHDAVNTTGLATEKGLVATLEEEDLGEWIRHLLCHMQASLERYFEITELDGDARGRIFEQLNAFRADGVVRIEGDTLIIEEDAKALARSVAAVFDPQVAPERQFASPAV